MRILTTVMAFGLAALPCLAQGTISTVAGSANCCNSADGLQATSAWLASAAGIVFDRHGNLYIVQASTSKIRKVSPSGILTTVAGNGTLGYSGDGGPATSAALSPSGADITGLAIDASGNLFFSDVQNHVVRKIDANSGIINTVAGNGTPGFAGDGDAATKAQLNYPADLVFDGAGNLYIADSNNERVRKVDTAGTITTFAGNGNVAYSGDGVQATATAVHRPEGLAFDSAGNLYISETSDSRVRRVDSRGIITTVAGQTKKTNGFSGDGGPATAATLAGPIGLVVDNSGNLYIADNSNGRIRKVDAAGIITTYAGITGNASTPIGDGGPATKAFLGIPKAVTLDGAGNLHIAGSAGGVVRVRKVTAGAALSTNPASLSFSYSTGGTPPASQTVDVSFSGAAVKFDAAISSGGNWLSVTPASATTPATLTVSVKPAGLASGVYQGAITLTPASGSQQSFAVTLTVSGASAPSFTAASVVNALGYQTKLAPDTVFVIFGSGMGPASLVAGTGPDYSTSLGGTSITFTPSGGGTAINAKMVYSSAGQIAGLLPSSIAPGAYAVSVSYGGIPSAPQNVTVVARSFGIATANSAGTGTAQATIGNVNGGISLTRFTRGSVTFNGLNWTLSPAHPGDTLVLWGTGGGADAANDTGGTSGDQTQAGNFRVNVSGRQITPLYAGASSGYPGLWQVNFVLPADINPDCFASVQVTAGGESSNAVSIPIAASGQDVCYDPQLNKDALTLLDSGGSIAVGGFGVSKGTSTTTVGGSTNTASQENAGGGIGLYTAAEYAAIYGGIKIGPCSISDRTASSTAKNPASPERYLDAGAPLPFSGPGIAAGAGLTVVSSNPGPVYDLAFAAGTLVGGGKYTIKGNGGRDIGAFTASVDFPASFTIANWDSLNSIDRSKPLILNWTATGTDQVDIIGSTYSVIGKDASNANILHTVSFTCQVPAAPGTYTIPQAVLSYLLPEGLDAASLAKGSGILSVEAVNGQTFSAPLPSGVVVGYTGISGVLSFSRNLAVQ